MAFEIKRQSHSRFYAGKFSISNKNLSIRYRLLNSEHTLWRSTGYNRAFIFGYDRKNEI